MVGRQVTRRESIGFIVLGLAGILVAALTLAFPYTGYGPDDVRSQPWFDPVFRAFLATVGLVFLVIGVVHVMRRG